MSSRSRTRSNSSTARVVRRDPDLSDDDLAIAPIATDSRRYKNFPKNWPIDKITSYIQTVLGVRPPPGLTRRQYQDFLTDNAPTTADHNINTVHQTADNSETTSTTITKLVELVTDLTKTVTSLAATVSASASSPVTTPSAGTSSQLACSQSALNSLATARFSTEDPFHQADGQVQTPGTTRISYPDQVSPSVSANSATSDDLNLLWTRTVAPSTRAAYDVGLRTFLTFMSMTGPAWWPHPLPALTENTLLLFVAHCQAKLQIRSSTIKLYVNGIRFHYLLHGMPNPWSSGHLLRLHCIMTAIKKMDPPSRQVRLPITISILAELCTLFDNGFFSHYMDELMKTVCCTAFFAFLRCGEFTCESYNPNLHLSISSIQTTSDDNFTRLLLKASKTDPFRRGSTVLLCAVDSPYCPVKALRKYVLMRTSMGAHHADPLFTTEQGRPLSRKEFIHLLHLALSALGHDPSQYSGHSFRIGAATSASCAQIPDHLIKTMGRWSSDCYVRYIRVPPTSLALAHKNLVDLL